MRHDEEWRVVGSGLGGVKLAGKKVRCAKVVPLPLRPAIELHNVFISLSERPNLYSNPRKRHQQHIPLNLTIF